MTTSPLTPPTTTELTLTAPDPVPVVETTQALALVPVPAEKQNELRAKANSYVAELLTIDPKSPAYAAKTDSLLNMGGDAVRASASTSNRMLNGRMATLAGAKSRGPENDAQVRVATTLGELRTTVTELTPNRADLTGVHKFLGLIPGGKKITRYFERYQDAQSQLDDIIKALGAGQDELRRDNDSIQAEKVSLWTTLGQLAEYSILADSIGAEIERKIDEARARGDEQAVTTLTSDALFPVRQRHQDLLTQTAVAVQGYLALDLIRNNNIELIKGVERAQTTTVSALRTAVIVAQALNNQKLVLDQINALNDTTNAMILTTADLLKQQTVTLHEQASSSGVSVETLQKAFDDVFATMDAVDNFRAKAVVNMGATVEALEAQVVRARPYLERARGAES